jgi:glycosyltransferase involved in cell wall biosynthesis
MHVGMAVPAFLPAVGYGGPVWNIIRLIDSLASRQIESVVLCSTLSDSGTADLPAGRTEIDGMAIQRMPVRFAYRWSPIVRWQAPQTKIDILHVFGLWNGLSYSAIRWANRSGTPWVWEPSGMLPTRGQKRWLKKRLTPYHVRLARTASGIIWTAPQEREEAPAPFRQFRHWMRANPSPDISDRVLPDRQSARRALGLPETGPIWGYLGRIANRKGIPALLQTWKSSGGPGLLCITGHAEDPQLIADIERAGDNVRLCPPVTPDERWTYLRAIDGLVLLPDYGENYALVVVEAIAAGTPALVSPAVGAGFWLRGHGATIVAPPYDDLAKIFRSGEVPAESCSIPPVLTLPQIGQTQAEIYQDAIEKR